MNAFFTSIPYTLLFRGLDPIEPSKSPHKG
ncbi:protein of unknown function [Candidatus Methylomirabilis oxygeniifera]|uniref:Uncharacterized protein n=1 Tax=Methylomirabilis oxygeniifera TaxID=671143 RepID=D5MKJ9_METO1|nr:protein of unknown function [Candidatus Methylomirabilis oxyfera]